MATTVSNLPDDNDSLKGIILSLQETHTQKEQYQAQLKSLETKNIFLEDENAILSEQVRFFKASLYAGYQVFTCIKMIKMINLII
jgi:hypothetical protein